MRDLVIAPKELLPILIAPAVWGYSWAKALGVVAMRQRRGSSCPEVTDEQAPPPDALTTVLVFC